MAHQLLTTDFIGGSFATDHGPYEGLYLLSSDDRGQTWSGLQRVSQAERHADRGALASSGPTLYAAWVTIASYDHYDPASRRILYVRSDPNGTPAGWGSTARLSKTKGRVDAPSIAASGDRVVVVWTDANTGDVRSAVSKDRGKTWARKVLGKARGSDPGGEGRAGLPSVAAAGQNMGVAWLATSDGAVRARLSKNGGRTWGPTTTLAPSGGAANGGSPSVSGAGNRLVFSWTTPAGVWAKTWTAGSWGATAQVEAFGGSGPHGGGYDVGSSIAPGGTIGLIWSACRASSCDPLSGEERVELEFSQSADGGRTWSAPSLVHGSVDADQRVNDGGSIVWIDGQTRLTTYAGAVSGSTTYRVYARVGNGS